MAAWKNIKRATRVKAQRGPDSAKHMLEVKKYEEAQHLRISIYFQAIRLSDR